MKDKQRIYPGRTKSDIPGVFTAGVLVYSLTEDEYAQFVEGGNTDSFTRYAERSGFAVDTERYNEEIDHHVTLALPKDFIATIMATYGFSDEEWDATPDSVKVKIINEYHTR